MTLVKINEQCLIEQEKQGAYRLHFGVISIGIPEDELISLASMFTQDTGSDMADDSICSLSQLHGSWYRLTYRAFTMNMCPHALAKFSALCSAAYEKLIKMKSPDYQKSIDDIAAILSAIEQKNQER